ncbi:glycosyltransferase family 2 protein [Agromyces binzhouensis]|uniref:Glycosyltransferase family 2 protein n=1 Tax=Agromyces binzhouensis TaxID=1817495 RepID=A0A4Q2JEE8_9MICO|nr:glycosyltransferase family A protein [Agromyces binzhouensis]RXZ45902.1 glycosyltransferase family 2 protein [Agromyces binzhouensis]
MELGLVVSTLGRVEPLRRLLDSLSGRLASGDELVIVAQRNVEEVEALVEGFDAGSGRAVVTTSAPGAARGRNRGVASLDGDDPLLVFPNDTTWFPAGSLEALRSLPAQTRLAAMTVVDEHGPKFVLPTPGTPFDRWNAWSVIEMGLLVRRSLFDAVGGFDPDLGTGAPTPWQAGEATDLLLRIDDRAPRETAGIVWLPPSVSVGGIADAHGLERAERRRKLRAYGRGLGLVVTRWRYPWPWRVAFVGGGLAFGLRHGGEYGVLDGWWVFIGRLEGALGRTFGGSAPVEAVRR